MRSYRHLDGEHHTMQVCVAALHYTPQGKHNNGPGPHIWNPIPCTSSQQVVTFDDNAPNGIALEEMLEANGLVPI